MFDIAELTSGHTEEEDGTALATVDANANVTNIAAVEGDEDTVDNCASRTSKRFSSNFESPIRKKLPTSASTSCNGDVSSKAAVQSNNNHESALVNHKDGSVVAFSLGVYQPRQDRPRSMAALGESGGGEEGGSTPPAGKGPRALRRQHGKRYEKVGEEFFFGKKTLCRFRIRIGSGFSSSILICCIPHNKLP